ncbi:hypothetical protein ACIRU8_10270 [Streptomyces sp. NPDC101175]|uniref:hypothetical protein n=1 Tax=Streptomyces sp. NPDC101175 TaxID=3366123 RepID=UPI003837B4A3
MEQIQILIAGMAIGVWAANIANAYWAHRDRRRAHAESAAALKRAAGDVYLNSFRLYRLQHRTEVRW